jgi:S-adenosylmethionine synthetase
MMFGYAVNETPELMPLTISISHALMAQAARVRRAMPSLGFRPDAKAQVSVVYENGVPKKIDTIVVSQQHNPDVDLPQMQERIREHVINPVLAQYQNYVDGAITYHLNPTGKFVIGGPQGDTGLTGRKIIVDTYGGMAPHGGGAFSGKDPTKVDRSAAYMARHVAKCLVAAGLADRCEVQLAYAIGVSEPVSVHVDTQGTGKVADEKIVDLVRQNFKLTPRGIIEYLNLRRPIYRKTAAGGHFGRNEPEFTWEKTDRAAALKADA